MSKSLYEQYAEKVQPEVLKETKTFEEAIESLKKYKNNLSKEYLEWAEEVVADIFNKSYAEVRDCVNEEEAWISISGMYHKFP